MASAFLSKTVITNSDELFGRDLMLKQLITLANNGNSVAVIGPRRFGKSSIIRCVETALRKSDGSKVYPIYYDFKEVGSTIKGTANVFRYMIACFVASLSKDKIFDGEIEIKKVIINENLDWEDVYENLSQVNAVRIQGVFEELITFFSELMGKSILFLIDEYEWLFRFSFDEPVGFMKLRNLSSKQLNNGINPFSFWIAGATPWDYLCSITGSPELNVIDAPVINVDNIEFDHFQRMWESEISKLEYPSQFLKNSCESVFKASGGIPFYGKLLGSHILTSDEPIRFTLLQSHLQELYDSLKIEQKLIVNEIATAPRNLKTSKFLLELVDKGLVWRNNKSYELQSGFFKDFIVTCVLSGICKNASPQLESHVLTEKIENLILIINQTHHNKKGKYIFEPVVDDSALMKDLRTPCYSIELFSDFASSLYKIVFERTKHTDQNGNDVTKGRLPQAFKRGNEFINIVDIMRHSLGKGHIMDKFTSRPGQMTKARMLEILTNSRNEPVSPDDFSNLQIKTLKLFEAELDRLNELVRTAS